MLHQIFVQNKLYTKLSRSYFTGEVGYLLAVVEDDGAVGPTVMVDQAQVGEKTHTNSLQASLVTHCESITLNLQRGRQKNEEEKCGERRRYPGLFLKMSFQGFKCNLQT